MDVLPQGSPTLFEHRKSLWHFPAFFQPNSF
jgi:hypothetical protein